MSFVSTSERSVGLTAIFLLAVYLLPFRAILRSHERARLRAFTIVKRESSSLVSLEILPVMGSVGLAKRRPISARRARTDVSPGIVGT